MPTPDLWLLLGLTVGWLVLVMWIEYRLSGRAPDLPEPTPAPDLIDRLRLAVALSRHHLPQPLNQPAPTLYSREDRWPFKARPCRYRMPRAALYPVKSGQSEGPQA